MILYNLNNKNEIKTVTLLDIGAIRVAFINKAMMHHCQESKSPNAPSGKTFPLRMHHKNNLNVLSGLATHWDRSPWVHCWFKYNVGAPWLQAAGCPLYSKDDPMVIALEPSRNLDCSSRVHAPLLIM